MQIMNSLLWKHEDSYKFTYGAAMMGEGVLVLFAINHKQDTVITIRMPNLSVLRANIVRWLDGEEITVYLAASSFGAECFIHATLEDGVPDELVIQKSGDSIAMTPDIARRLLAMDTESR